MIKHESHVEDAEDENGRDVCRWVCSCRSHGRWEPESERLRVAVRGEAHTTRFRKKRPTKAQLAARKGKAREAGPEEYQGLRSALDLGGGF